MSWVLLYGTRCPLPSERPAERYAAEELALDRTSVLDVAEGAARVKEPEKCQLADGFGQLHRSLRRRIFERLMPRKM